LGFAEAELLHVLLRLQIIRLNLVLLEVGEDVVALGDVGGGGVHGGPADEAFTLGVH